MLGLLKKRPKYKLTHDARGTYTLEELEPDIGVYLAKEFRITEEQASKAIKNLERNTRYWNE